MSKLPLQYFSGTDPDLSRQLPSKRTATYWIAAFAALMMINCDASFGPSPGNDTDDTPTPTCLDSIPEPVVVADENFEGGATGWTDNTTDNTEAAAFSEFLGRHAAAIKAPTEVVSKQFPLSGNQTWLSLDFDLYQIDSWNREDFLIYVDGKVYSRHGFQRNFIVKPNPMTAFLGPFGTGAQPSKTYQLDGIQTQVTIDFDFYQIDSWDEEPFQIYIDNVLVINHKYKGGNPILPENETGSFPGGTFTASTTQTGELGFGRRHSAWLDGIHHYTLTLDNTASSLNVRFQMNANEPAYNEAFGIDNIIVKTDSSGTVSSEDFEAGVGEGWDTSVWHSNPTITTVTTGPLGFAAGTSDDDGIHHYHVSIPTNSTNVVIGFGDILDSGAGALTETWGIDNLILYETCKRE